MYSDEDMLMLSGIQHFYFCKRQWSLIHVEQQWGENRLTVEGAHLHENVDNPMYSDRRGGAVTVRAVALVSKELGLRGTADAVEMRSCAESPDAVWHPKFSGRWNILCVEYKRGHAKPDIRDEIQLCAQTMCLEEMYGIHIPLGCLYYGEERRRRDVEMTDGLRGEVKSCAAEMHSAFENGVTFPPVKKAHCKSCSLLDICMPKSSAKSASEYLERLKI